MSGPRQSTRPRKASARAREAAADAEDEPPKTPVKRQKQTKTVATPAPPATQEEDDAWAQCDACQKWRLLPKDHVVNEGKQWTCSLVGRSCDERADDERGVEVELGRPHGAGERVDLQAARRGVGALRGDCLAHPADACGGRRVAADAGGVSAPRRRRQVGH